LPKATKLHKAEHMAALPYAQIPAVMASLRGNKDVAAKLVEFLVLTAGRLDEARLAVWNEFDFEIGVWTVPANRMKGGRKHRVPLTSRMLEVLHSLPRSEDSTLVFPSCQGAKVPLSGITALDMLRRFTGDSSTLHGCRSTFRDWAGDCTAVQREVVEAALAHVLGDQTEAAYRRSDALQKRRALMEAWSNYCSGEPADEKVVQLIKPAA
jgi:integrase